MFGVELYAGSTADSHALKADALDFFGDAANYAISLLVAGMALTWRARAALLEGGSLTILGVYVLVGSAFAALNGSAPQPETMGIIGVFALVANVAVALLLLQFRTGDANMRSVWICSRNDAIGNIAVVAAAAGVFGTGTAWPNLLVATTLGIPRTVRRVADHPAGSRRTPAGQKQAAAGRGLIKITALHISDCRC